MLCLFCRNTYTPTNIAAAPAAAIEDGTISGTLAPPHVVIPTSDDAGSSTETSPLVDLAHSGPAWLRYGLITDQDISLT